MKLVKIDPRKIKVPEVRVTSQMDPETEQEFKRAVAEWGIETPPLCYQVGDDLVLVDGKHRLDEALEHQLPVIDVVVRPGDMIQVLTRNIYLDHLRGKHKVSDMVRVIKSLYDDYGLDTDQIAEQTYKNRDYVERLLIISKAFPAVLDAVDRGDFGVGVAEQVARLPTIDQQEMMVAQLGKFKMTTKEVRDFVDNVIEEMKKLPAGPPTDQVITAMAPPVYHCEGCRKETDKRFLAPVMLCPGCFGNVWQLARDQAQDNGGKVEETGAA